MTKEQSRLFNGDTEINMWTATKYTVGYWRLIALSGAAGLVLAIAASFILDKNIVLMAAVGLVGGVALAVLAVMLYAMITNTLHDVSDLPDEAALLGVIENSTKKSKLWPFGKPQMAQAKGEEADDTYSQILCSLELQREITENNIAVFSSDYTNSQRAAVVLELAAAAAKQGKNVLLIDTDFTSDALTTLTGVSAGRGFSDLLFALRRAEDVIIGLEEYGISFIPSGKRPVLYHQKLGAGDHRKVLAKLAAAYDIVLINGSHIGGTAVDALMLAEAAAGIVLVAVSGETNFDSYARAYDKIGRTKAVMLGNIFVK